MNGAQSLVRTLLGAGVDTCFANPGTSEMHFVAALDQIPGMHCVLGLFEGVVTGAADGYARMAGRPAATLLHCGPGLANGLANLHNARRGRVPVVNIVGDQATYHRPLDAPLTADTEGLARSVSAWVRTAQSADRVGLDAAEAIQAAHSRGGQIATLILPSDVSWDEGGLVAAPLPVPLPDEPDDATVDAVVGVVRSGEPTLFLLSGAALMAHSLSVAHGICSKYGTAMLAQTSNARMQRGAGRHYIERLPYPVDLARRELAGFRHIVLVGAAAPVGFFAYPGKPGRLYPDSCAIHTLARPDQDGPAALQAVADRLGVVPSSPEEVIRPERAKGAVSSEAMAQTLAALMPEQAIVVDESVTFGRGLFPLTRGAPPHDWLQLTGGAIGDGLPMSVGAAIAAPGRRVITLQADGSALYTVQALWTQARERLDVTTIIFSNRKYAILLGELAGVGAEPGPTALSMMDLGSPSIDWCRIAEGMGVEAARAETIDQFGDLLSAANRRDGPFLIELMT